MVLELTQQEVTDTPPGFHQTLLPSLTYRTPKCVLTALLPTTQATQA